MQFSAPEPRLLGLSRVNMLFLALCCNACLKCDNMSHSSSLHSVHADGGINTDSEGYTNLLQAQSIVQAEKAEFSSTLQDCASSDPQKRAMTDPRDEGAAGSRQNCAGCLDEPLTYRPTPDIQAHTQSVTIKHHRNQPKHSGVVKKSRHHNVKSKHQRRKHDCDS